MATPRTVQIDLASAEPAYKQIVSALRAQLVAGRIEPDETLPPVRQLAVELGVHFNTVAEAYRVLADEGWLELRRRRGALVLDRATPKPPPPEQRTSFVRRLDEIVAEGLSQGLTPRQVAASLTRLANGLNPMEESQ